MSLLTYLEQQIDQDILDREELTSTDQMRPNDLQWKREQYYRALWAVLDKEIEEAPWR